MKRGLKALLWIVAFQLIGMVMGYITGRGIEPWYLELHKSPLTPKPIVFSIVWPILYTMLAIAAMLLWERRHDAKYKTLGYLFALQLIVNWAWTPLFFAWHFLAISFLWLCLLTCLTLATILKAFKHCKVISIMLAPYFVWLCFACYLNGFIYMHN